MRLEDKTMLGSWLRDVLINICLYLTQSLNQETS